MSTSRDISGYHKAHQDTFASMEAAQTVAVDAAGIAAAALQVLEYDRRENDFLVTFSFSYI